MPTTITGTAGVNQVAPNTLTVSDVKTGETIGFNKMQLFAAKATTSGTSIDFSPADGTGIPSWAKKITVSLAGVSTNGVSNYQIQLGTGAGLEVAGYVGGTEVNVTIATSTAGMAIVRAHGAASLMEVQVTLVKVSGDTWLAAGTFYVSDANRVGYISARKTLSGTLDRIRLTTINGTDLFDAGSMSILVEGYE